MRLTNLTTTAVLEFRTIIRGSRDYGPENALRLQSDFLSIFTSVGNDRALGHVRSDVVAGPDVRFITVKRTQFVVYDQKKRLVLRIIHGRRDFRALILDEPDPA